MYIAIIYTVLLVVAIYIISLIIYIIGNLISKNRIKYKDNPSVSVIIAVKNGEKSLPKLLNDLENQNYEGKYEFIIVDDQSTDDTKNIIKSLAKNNKIF